jgi:hypothetical protein
MGGDACIATDEKQGHRGDRAALERGAGLGLRPRESLEIDRRMRQLCSDHHPGSAQQRNPTE